jgi:hypothetical protein
MNLSGQLADWSMDDLIQIVQVTKKSGSLDIRGAAKGRVHFRDGQLTGAELHGPQGVYAGTDPETVADIIFVLGALDTGTFAMGPDDGPDTAGHDGEAIASAVLELRKLETDLVDSGIFADDEVRFVSEIDTKLTIAPQDWRLISSLIPALTVSYLEDRYGRGSAIRMLHSFHALGILAPAENDEPGNADTPEAEEGDDTIKGEADWLEQLADRVSKGDSADWVDETAVEIAISAGSGKEPAHEAQGVSADASTLLTGGVYDEIRRLRSKSSS